MNTVKKMLLIFLFTMAGLSTIAAGNNGQAKKIVVIGMNDNVKSNYYYNKMIAEEIGIEADTLDMAYNRSIIMNIAEAATQNGYRVIPFLCEECPIAGKISIEGEEENCVAVLSGVGEEELDDFLTVNDADYVLVLNQHYLKYQDKPMQTIFHYVCFSLFDKDKNEIVSDNYYFTCINPEQPEKIKKISRKSTSKMMANLLKTMDRTQVLAYDSRLISTKP